VMRVATGSMDIAGEERGRSRHMLMVTMSLNGNLV